MIYLKVAFLIACMVAGILFCASNQQPTALFFFTYATKTFPLYLLLLAAFLFGTIAAFLYNILGGSDMRTQEKLAQERVKELEKLTRERQAQLETARKAKAKDEQERKPAPAPDLAEKG